MKRLLILLFIIINIGCQKNNETYIKHLDGYWEIEKVILASGEEHVYNFNEFIDYFNVNDSLKGFRKKLKPTLNGTFEATNDAEEFLNAIKQAAKADYFSEYVVLVLDNAAIHTKEMVRWLWMEHRVLVIFLPTRSPECNILN